MKRDNNTPAPIYFSPPSPNITFNAYNHRFPQRESLPLDQISNNRAQEFQQRYSSTLDSGQSNNAFTHLRNEISNLRSQFTKLIQKDATKEEKAMVSTYKKDQRVTAHSTIGFYNQNDIKVQSKNEIRNDPVSLKNKIACNEAKNSNDDGKVKKDDSKYHKKYSFQLQQKKEDNGIILDSKKIQELQVEIRKLGQIKFKVEQENLALKKQLIKIERQTSNKTNGSDFQNEKLRKNIQQAQISLSLKNSLVQKLESEHDNLKKLIKHYEEQNRNLQSSLQMCRKQLQAVHSSHKSEMEKIRLRHEEQIRCIQNIHQTNINELLTQLSASQKAQRTLQMNLLLKQEECQQLSKEKSRYQEKYQEQIGVIETFQMNIKDLQAQQQKINQQYISIQFKNTQFQGKNDDQRIKMLEDENTDLKKRVQSYKKTVEQLNSSNNSGRDKLVIAKDQARKHREQAKFLSEELSVKEKLITSLYRDINILDAEIRHTNVLKSVLTLNLKYIDQLNQNIVQLQCGRLNEKYKQALDHSAQLSS